MLRLERIEEVLAIIVVIISLTMIGATLIGIPVTERQESYGHEVPLIVLRLRWNTTMAPPHNLSLRPIEGGVIVSWQAPSWVHTIPNGTDRCYILEGWNYTANRTKFPNVNIAVIEDGHDTRYEAFVPAELHKMIAEYAVHVEDICEAKGVLWAYNRSRFPIHGTGGTGGDNSP